MTPLAQLESAMDSADPYLTAESVAERLGLPLSLLIRRLEAGDVAARRVDGPTGPTYELRLSDLGIEPSPEEDVPEVEVTGTAQQSIDPFAPPARSATTIVSHSQQGPLAEVAAMSIDPRELVAGLLDRWERTLEQRIYAEQRQRFESELLSRQAMVKQLQMELKTVRAEASATDSDKLRQLSDRNHKVENLERQLGETKYQLGETKAQLQEASGRKRGWFRRR